MKIASTFLVSLICIQIFAWTKNNKIGQPNNPITPSNTDTTKMKITISTNVFSATLADNETAAAFKAKLPMTVSMTEFGGNEKFYDLPDNLPTNASNPGTIQTGDLMLYGSRTFVLFYKTFSTSYTYTRLGRIDDPSGLATALGSGNTTVTFELE